MVLLTGDNHGTADAIQDGRSLKQRVTRTRPTGEDVLSRVRAASLTSSVPHPHIFRLSVAGLARRRDIRLTADG